MSPTLNRCLKSAAVMIYVVLFGIVIVGASYNLAKIIQDPPSVEAINLFVTAILGSAVTVVAILEITKEHPKT